MARELSGFDVPILSKYPAILTCDSFLDSRAALEEEQVAAVLPDFLVPGPGAKAFNRVPIPGLEKRVLQYFLAWNPRLIRLNPTAKRRLDWLEDAFSKHN
jgi:DNA-binding transcriptional LysR family regulator